MAKSVNQPPQIIQTNLSGSNFFPALTGIRAIAAFMVYFFHFNPFKKGSPALFSFVNEFHVGVALFFTLSGFLICYRYCDDLKFTRAWMVRYLINRVARIYPMYFLLTTATLVYYFYTRDASFFTTKEKWIYFANISFFRGFFDDLKFTYVAQGWSLTVEECFYFTAPLIFSLRRRITLFFQAILVLGVGVLLVLICRQFEFYGLFESFGFLFRYTFFGRCVEFFVGVQLALMYKSYEAKRHISTSKISTHVGLFFIIACIALLSMLKGNNDIGVRHPMGMFINNAVLPVCIAVFFWGLLTEKSLLRKMLAHPIFVLLGKSSYVFYLIHYGFVYTLLKLHVTGNISLLFILLNLLSILLFLGIEEPLNKWIRKLAPAALNTTKSDEKLKSVAELKPVASPPLKNTFKNKKKRR